MKGANECLEVMVEVHRQCAVTDKDIEVWRPQMEAWQMLADTHSKYEDNAQWELNPWVHELILAQPELGERRPVCDLFTDEPTTKAPGGFTHSTGTRLH